MITKPAHAVCYSLWGWGHLRPMLHFLHHLLLLQPDLNVSLIIDPSFAARVAQEMVEHPHSDDLKSRIQILGVPDIGVNPTDPSRVDALPRCLEGLFGGVGSKFGRPTLAINDWFQIGFLPVLEATLTKLDKRMIPIFVWTPMLAVAVYQFWAPLEEGGLFAKWRASGQKLTDQGEEKYPAMAQTYWRLDDSVIHVPGIEQMYEWEFLPQIGTLEFPPPISEMIAASKDMAFDQRVKGLIMPPCVEREEEPIRALERILGKRVFAIGPQFSADVWDGQIDLSPKSNEEREVMSFLDAELRNKGVRSVVYIGFGSMFWPVKRPEILRWLIEAIPSDMSIILSDSPMFSCLTEDMKSEFQRRGKVVKLAPQWKILNHPALACFVSHLGLNSFFEAILAGVPVVAFPFAADQGVNAEILCKQIRGGIELEQIRSFVDGKTRMNGITIHSTEENVKEEVRTVVERIRGAEGDEMRANLKTVKDELEKSWKEGGSRKAMGDFAAVAMGG